MPQLTFTHSIFARNLRHALALLMSVAFLVAVQAAGTPALSAGLAPVSEEEREQRFQELSDRLELTEEQEPEVKSILAADRESRLALLRENGVDIEAGEKPSMFTMMGMRSDMNALSERTRENLSGILSAEQIDTYDTIVSERRAEMRASFGR
eukprot:s1_g1187.t1